MKIEDVFSKLKPALGGDEVDRLWRAYIAAPPNVRRLMEKNLRLRLARKAGSSYEDRNILLEPPPSETARGEYRLGTVYYGTEERHLFGLREHELIQHVGIFGRSGAGKTNLSFILVLELLRNGKPFLIFDWKRNYRDLLARPESGDIVIYTVGRDVAPFAFNPLIPPPGTQPTVWLKKLIEVMGHAYFLGEGCAFLLQKAIDTVYRRFGVYTGRPKRWPTIEDVRDFLYKYKARGREASWMESTMRAVGVLCFGEVGRVLNSADPTPIADLLEKPVILELDALVNSDKTFLIESLLLWIHHYRLAGQEKETFKHAIVIEEAHHVLLRKKQEATGEEAVTDVILREIRELGECIVLLDQHPSLISKPGLGNTYCTISMNLKHRGDISMIADSILINAETMRYLGKLEVGWAMVKLQDRWFKPFLVRFPHLKVNKGAVTDEMLRERFPQAEQAEQPEGKPGFSEESKNSRETCSAFHRDVNPVTKKEEVNPDEPRPDSKGCEPEPLKPIERASSPAETRPEPGELASEELALLKDVEAHRFDPVRERYKRVGLSPRKGTDAQTALLEKGLVFSEYVYVGRGKLKLLGLTNKGRRALGLPLETGRVGGLKHAYWQHTIAEKLKKQGWQVEIEHPIGDGKAVDIVAEKDGKRIAIEIETGKSDAIANIKKALGADFDLIISCTTTREIKEDLKIKIRASDIIDSNVKCYEANKLIEYIRVSLDF